MGKRAKRVGRRIGDALPMWVCRLITKATKRWAPSIYEEARAEHPAERHIDGSGGG